MCNKLAHAEVFFFVHNNTRDKLPDLLIWSAAAAATGSVLCGSEKKQTEQFEVWDG